MLRLVVAYDGTDFVGSQRQPGGRTVQAELERAGGELFGPVRITLAGRTDRGVHAAGQVASWPDGRPDLSEETIRNALMARLPPDLAVIRVERVDAGFHARYDAVWREYRYRVWAGAWPPLARRQVWQRNGPLAVAEMAQAAALLRGEHDLAAFAGGGEGVPWSARQRRPRGTVRRVSRASCRVIEPWWGADPGTLIEIRLVADGFLPRMVRTVAAALVEIGRGAQPVAWIGELLAGRDRRQAAGTAPPHGLILWRVGYGDDVSDPDPTDLVAIES